MGCEGGLIVFPSREAMSARLADLIETELARGVCEDGAGEFALSGGSTPKPLYEALSKKNIDWGRVTATLVDERWVAPTADGSNEKFIREALLKEKAAGARFRGLYNGAATPKDGLAGCEKMLASRRKPFDVVLLGMGEDGHTASWFPHADGLGDALASSGQVAAIRARKSAVTGPFLDRMTLTLSAIRDARLLILMMAGDEKRATFARALEEGPIEEMPVRAVLRARPDLWACWSE
ncbi:MAG TPA: 6-phosphogluconolactonase [Parvularculaceae bacterium]|nr:6-phosphogluconolactonase [Parvularculaceae bacterium]